MKFTQFSNNYNIGGIQGAFQKISTAEIKFADWERLGTGERKSGEKETWKRERDKSKKCQHFTDLIKLGIS